MQLTLVAYTAYFIVKESPLRKDAELIFTMPLYVVFCEKQKIENGDCLLASAPFPSPSTFRSILSLFYSFVLQEYPLLVLSTQQLLIISFLNSIAFNKVILSPPLRPLDQYFSTQNLPHHLPTILYLKILNAFPHHGYWWSQFNKWSIIDKFSILLFELDSPNPTGTFFFQSGITKSQINALIGELFLAQELFSSSDF